jgi:ribA/ribD-fused uncharacterized protein
VTIRFYSAREQPYGCFSNFSAHPFELDGQWWPTSEHYFQANKFLSPADRDAVRSVTSPMQAARIGRSRSRPMGPDWEQVKDDLMRRAVLAKFRSHPDIAEILLGTGGEDIVEASPTDSYWGTGADDKGLNRLGQILMEVRAELRNG